MGLTPMQYAFALVGVVARDRVTVVVVTAYAVKKLRNQ